MLNFKIVSQGSPIVNIDNWNYVKNSKDCKVIEIDMFSKWCEGKYSMFRKYMHVEVPVT